MAAIPQFTIPFAIPPFCQSAIPRFRYSAIPQFRHSSIPPFCHYAVPPFLHFAIPPFRHSANPQAIPQIRHSSIPPFRHYAIPPFLHFAIPPFCHSANPPFHFQRIIIQVSGNLCLSAVPFNNIKDLKTACDVPVTNVTFFTCCTCAIVCLSSSVCTVNSTYVSHPY